MHELLRAAGDVAVCRTSDGAVGVARDDRDIGDMRRGSLEKQPQVQLTIQHLATPIGKWWSHASAGKPIVVDQVVEVGDDRLLVLAEDQRTAEVLDASV